MVLQYLTKSTSKEHDTFRNSEWGPEAAMSMSQQVREFPVVIGKDKLTSLGDIFDRTPQDRISKVVLEEKVFKTWYSGRTVLIGDGK